jgi:hypothetical protein
MLKSLLDAGRELPRSVFPPFRSLLAREVVGSCDTLLDLGCGRQSPVKEFSRGLSRVVGVDRHVPYLEESLAAGIHHEYRQADVLEIGSVFEPGSFDCVVALDLIEHLPKEEGLRLIPLMERIARKKVIIFTPNGFLEQRAYDDNALQEHLSGWSPAEMRALGYRVIGVNGWRPLRGERGVIRWRPEWLWRNVAFASQAVTVSRPESAFQILCVKDLS